MKNREDSTRFIVSFSSSFSCAANLELHQIAEAGKSRRLTTDVFRERCLSRNVYTL